MRVKRAERSVKIHRGDPYKCERSELANEVSRAKRDNRRLLSEITEGYCVIRKIEFRKIKLCN